MRKFILHIFAVSVAAVVCLACSSDKASVIPRGKLARIYAEMLVTDQWILAEPDFRRVADTTLVYEPILQKYGYDTQDYIKSVGYYMNDPERFARIFRSTVEIIDNQNLSDDQKQEAVAQMIQMTKIAEQEAAVETLILSKGFKEAVVSLTATGADVVVSSDELSDANRAQIEDIITRKTEISPENIVITPMHVID
mgnify:CR=1 FL=1